FVWLRLGNPRRWSYEKLLLAEWSDGVPGELGWSAEWRKAELRGPEDTRRWRQYCCESFCDTAAWLYAGAKQHDEFTLPDRSRSRRRKWFLADVGINGLSI